jgi:protein O-mannosyl-transferase
VAVAFVLGAIVLFTYCNTLYNTGFALDNKFIILEDPRLREANHNNLHLIFTQDYWWPKAVSGLYRPLTTLSYLFNYSTLGNGPTPPAITGSTSPCTGRTRCWSTLRCWC